MTVCFEGFEECIDKHILVFNTFFKFFKTNGHHNLQIYDILFYTWRIDIRDQTVMHVLHRKRAHFSDVSSTESSRESRTCEYGLEWPPPCLQYPGLFIFMEKGAKNILVAYTVIFVVCERKLFADV